MLVVSQPQANDPQGVEIKRIFDPNNPVHLERKHKCSVDADGWSNVVPIAYEKKAHFQIVRPHCDPWLLSDLGQEKLCHWRRVE